MPEQKIRVKDTLPDEGGCNLCPVELVDGEPVQQKGETTLSIGTQSVRLCRVHLVRLNDHVRSRVKTVRSRLRGTP